MKCHCTKISCPSNQVSEINATLIYLLPTAASLNKTLKRINNYKYQDFRINPLTPNGPYSARTAPLTSKRCILYIYSTNIGTEYFKHGI